MEAPANIPPIIYAPAPAQPRRSFTPAAVAGFVALAIIGATLSARLQVFFPQCTFLRLTGLPCAFCGGTRALRSIAQFHFQEAFWWNPLVTLSTIAVFGLFLYWLIAPPQIFDRHLATIKRLPLWSIAFTLIALNWIFLLLFLPR